MNYRLLLPLVLVGSLAACSSGGDGDGGDAGGNNGGNTTGGNTGGNNVVGGNQGGGEFGGRAGVLQGTVGAADGIYVLNSNNILAGVSIAADGSAVSTFGDLGEGANFSGNVTQLSHPASNNGAAGSFAPVGEEPANASLSVSIMDGMSIEGSGASLAYLSAGSLTTADAASLAGNWRGVHLFGDATVFDFILDLTFSGNSFTGSSDFFDAGVSQFPNTIDGSFETFGDVALVSFTWGSADNPPASYSGIAYLLADGTNRLALSAQRDAGQSDGSATISGLLSR